MSKFTVTRLNRRNGKSLNNDKEPKDTKLVHIDVLQRTVFGKQRENLKQLSGNVNKLQNKSVESRKPDNSEVIQAKRMVVTNNSREINVVHEEFSQKLITEQGNHNRLLDNVEGIVAKPQNIIIVHEEINQKYDLEKYKEKESFNKVNKVINNAKVSQDIIIVHEEVSQKTNYEIQKEKQKELLDKVNKKTAEYQASKPSFGVFTEIVTHGAFTPKTVIKDTAKIENNTPNKGNGLIGSKALLGFPSSANDLALDAKSDLESDPNISNEVKEKVIEKLFALVSMVQHVYESKVRVMTELEKFKDTHLKNELRREKEHSEQLYKLNMNFQNEVVQSIQRLKSELDISRIVSKNVEDDDDSTIMKTSSVDFNTSDDAQDLDTNDMTNSTDDLMEQCKPECLLNANEEVNADQQD